MHRMLLALLASLCLALGCGIAPQAPLPFGPPIAFTNPAYVPGIGNDYVFEQTVDVVDDFFTIDREEPVRQIGEVLTEGRIETFPETGATLLEPQRRDSAGTYERLESTLQSIRRRAVVRLIPTGGGLLIDVTVIKELEDVRRPEFATAGAATLRNDTSIQRYREPVGGLAPTVGWIVMGRDPALEQRIIGDLLARLGVPPQAAPVMGP